MNERYSHSDAEYGETECVQFSVMSSEEIANHSVVHINNGELFDKSVPKSRGLYDLRMGTLTKQFDCQTCNCDLVNCPGHFGHIELNEPMFNPSFFKTLIKILNCVCIRCSKLMVQSTDCKYSRRTMRFKYMYDASRKVTNCPLCAYVQPKLVFENWCLFFQFPESKTQITARQVFNVLRKLSETDCESLGLNYKYSKPKDMIIKNLIVPPPVVRPSVVMDSNSRTQDDLTQKLCEIIKINNLLLTCSDNESFDLKTLLQYHINTYMDNELPGMQQATQRTGRPIKSICQRIRTKEGRVRGNLMGKRVDFSARTVITAEPNIDLDELGVPISIARNMSVSETATACNIDFLQKCVDHGEKPVSSTYKVGAKVVWNSELGSKKDLRFAKDVKVQIGDIVDRHLMDGDIVVFNRQPTLHKMSMMGHRVRVMSGSTFRLNLSVTTPYNADFDGDEMNMHIPCSLEARAEVKELMMVPLNIISPQSNKPVIGIVQDALLACRLATSRNEFIDQEDFTNLMMSVDAWVLPKPAILKPRKLWTGKQLFNLIFPSVFCHQFSSWHDETEKPAFSVSDTEVYIDREGTFISGTLCKKTIGPTSNGLIHKTWLYEGPEAANKLISKIQFLANHWLTKVGFSVGIQDCVNSEQVDRKVRDFIDTSLRKVEQIDQTDEPNVNKILNSARDRSGKYISDVMTSKNNLYNMVTAGSKGSIINIAQIMSCVGQQNVNGIRMCNGYTDRTLPHFPRNGNGYESRGFVKHSYMNGLKPTEFFFHAMGGREGVIDTAIKTSETGYIQRRLVKAMEDVKIGYDNTVRNSIGDILQLSYGEDGFDGTFLITQTIAGKRVHLPFDLKMIVSKINTLCNKTKSTAESLFVESLLEPFSNNILIQKILHDACNNHKHWNEKQILTFIDLVNDRLQIARASPGEMVGTIAAQSLGQPITQMTLNTFHAAGISAQNLTMGVPRLKELINLSKCIKSPCMTIGLRHSISHKNIFVGVTLVNITTETIIFECMDLKDEEKEYLSIMGLDIESSNRRCAILKCSAEIMKKHNISTLDVTCAVFGSSESLWCSCIGNDIYVRFLEEVVIPSKEELVCYINKLKNEIILKGLKNISEAFYDENSELRVHTMGTDLEGILCHPDVDPMKTFSNDINEMYCQFGVEAARKTLLVEIKRVIEYDGSYLNYRHLSVLLDVMTYKGSLMAITRHGINRTETGVLMRCSFEETVNIILDAAVHAEKDNLRGVTENIIMGKLAKIGTGSMDILTHLYPPQELEERVDLFRPSSPSQRNSEFVRGWFPLKDDENLK
jgi:DNA-directed RNA polymerase beta' subunit